MGKYVEEGRKRAEKKEEEELKREGGSCHGQKEGKK